MVSRFVTSQKRLKLSKKGLKAASCEIESLDTGIIETRKKLKPPKKV